MSDKLNSISNELLNKNLKACSNEECYEVIKEYVARLEALREREDKYLQSKLGKKLYYISAEFLIGKLMSNNLINLGVYDEVRDELEAAGKELAQIEEIESEASLGNGGLGRLAACFLDSIANLGLNGDGVGLNYHLGLFRQVFENGRQKEVPDYWIGKDSWLIPTDVSYKIDFADFSVTSRMYDINVYGEKTTNKLHLFDIDTVNEAIVDKSGIDFDKEYHLLELIRAVHEIDGIERIRLGSLEPGIITEEFAEGIAKLPKMCPHFHLSLQSGCNATLKRMNRRYTAEEYYEKCRLLRKYFRNPALTTDVIVGFPGETEEEFAESKAFVDKVDFYETHIFKYSRREGTKAAAMKNQVPDQIKAVRSAELIELSHRKQAAYEERLIGTTQEVLIEEKIIRNGEELQIGHTKEYVKIGVKNPNNLINQLVNVEIENQLQILH